MFSSLLNSSLSPYLIRNPYATSQAYVMLSVDANFFLLKISDREYTLFFLDNLFFFILGYKNIARAGNPVSRSFYVIMEIRTELTRPIISLNILIVSL